MQHSTTTPGTQMTRATDAGLRVYIQLPVTREPECWARVSIAGELTREGLERLITYLDICLGCWPNPDRPTP
jgi:hypothetical protein